MRINDLAMEKVLEFNDHSAGGLFAQAVIEGVTFEVYSPKDSANLIMSIYGKDNNGLGANAFAQLGKYISIGGTISGKSPYISCLLK